jgi:hypothetical protein
LFNIKCTYIYIYTRIYMCVCVFFITVFSSPWFPSFYTCLLIRWDEQMC